MFDFIFDNWIFIVAVAVFAVRILNATKKVRNNKDKATRAGRGFVPPETNSETYVPPVVIEDKDAYDDDFNPARWNLDDDEDTQPGNYDREEAARRYAMSRGASEYLRELLKKRAEQTVAEATAEPAKPAPVFTPQSAPASASVYTPPKPAFSPKPFTPISTQQADPYKNAKPAPAVAVPAALDEIPADTGLSEIEKAHMRVFNKRDTKRRTLREKLANLSSIQQAVVMAEIIGRPGGLAAQGR